MLSCTDTQLWGFKTSCLNINTECKIQIGIFPIGHLEKKIDTKYSWGLGLYIPALSNELQMTFLLLKYMSRVIWMQEEMSQSSGGTAITKIDAFPQVLSF